jgi:hypothetical protein
VGFDEGIIAQDGNPGIPVSAAGFLAKQCRKLVGVRMIIDTFFVNASP